jgi:hypothetical protein
MNAGVSLTACPCYFPLALRPFRTASERHDSQRVEGSGSLLRVRPERVGARDDRGVLRRRAARSNARLDLAAHQQRQPHRAKALPASPRSRLSAVRGLRRPNEVGLPSPGHPQQHCSPRTFGFHIAMLAIQGSKLLQSSQRRLEFTRQMATGLSRGCDNLLRRPAKPARTCQREEVSYQSLT